MKLLYSVKEVSNIMRTNPEFVYSLIKSGRLVAMKLGSYKIRHETLMRYFEESDGVNMLHSPDKMDSTAESEKEKHVFPTQAV